MLGSGSVMYPRRAATTSTSLLARPRLGALRSYVRPRGAHPSTPDMARSRKSKARMSKRKALSLENKANNISYIERGVDVCRKYGLNKSTRSSGVAPNGPVLKRKDDQLAKLLDNNKEFVCSERWLDRWKTLLWLVR
uniref:Uncharacterized protein n=1 Tax=Timema monikensis TaxID=170555 RepID=A0A7R9ECT9_9NEOP|nr:unnamed protein product [Timema monikensis]